MPTAMRESRLDEPTAANLPIVDVLRALAIMAVVAFHSQLPFFACGYAGVDVFFVVSGYVISRLINRERSANAFSWAHFYCRRALRLLPLLAICLITTVASSWLILAPFGALQELHKSAMASSVAVTNFYLSHYSGSYFDPGVETYPLLHIWSLAVEEQFYIALPLVFLLHRIFSCISLPRLLTFLSLISFCFAVWAFFNAHIIGFYWPFSRAWQFALGAWAGYQPNRPLHVNQKCSPLKNVVLTLLTIILLSPLFDQWPEAVVSAISTAVSALFLRLIAPSDYVEAVRPFFARKILVWIGRRSYGWYLFHWPAIALVRAEYMQDVSPVTLLAAGLLSILPAALLHISVEQPMRKLSVEFWNAERINTFALLTMASLFTVFFLLAIKVANDETPKRWSEMRASVEHRAMYCEGAIKRNDPLLITPCELGDVRTSAAHIYLLGDSHAGHLTKALESSVSKNRQYAKIYWSPACAPYDNPDTDTSADPQFFATCSAMRRKAAEDILLDLKSGVSVTIVFSARWEPYIGELPLNALDRRYRTRRIYSEYATPQQMQQLMAESISHLQNAGAKIIIVAPTPEFAFPVPECIVRLGRKNCETPRGVMETYRARTISVLRRLEFNLPGVKVIDSIDSFCNQNTCPIAGDDGKPWYLDNNHLSNAGNQIIEPLLNNALSNAQSKDRQTKNDNGIQIRSAPKTVP